MPKMFSAVETARILGVDPSSIWRWTNQGLITPNRRTLGGPTRRGRIYFTEARIEQIRKQLTPAAETADPAGVETR